MKEFWERCGFRYELMEDDSYTGNWYWFYPHEQGGSRNAPRLTLDNLFKYAVPSLGFDIKFIQWVDGDFEVDLLDGEHTIVAYSKDKDPAQALYQAIAKIIEGENGKGD